MGSPDSAIRALDFSNDRLVAASSQDLFVLDSTTGKTSLKKANAHSNPINTLKSIGDHLIATGDDEGVIKICKI